MTFSLTLTSMVGIIIITTIIIISFLLHHMMMLVFVSLRFGLRLS